MSLLARGLCLAFLLTGLAGAPAAHAAPEDWRFLHTDGSLFDGSGTFRSIIKANLGVTRFSPDGTRLATGDFECDDNQCNDGAGFVRIHRPDGGVTDLAGIPHFSISSLAWAPDKSAVAVLGEWFDPGGNDIRIYRVPVDGSAPVQVYSDTQLLLISKYAGLTWHPTNGTLAFVASEDPDRDGFIELVDSDQVFTVNASGGTPTRYSGRQSCPTECTTHGFTQPLWSPDGTRLAVGTGARDEFGPVASYIGVLSQGAVSATKVVDGFTTGPMAWSSDGSMLAHGTPDVSEDNYNDTRIIDMTSGTVAGHVEGVIAEFTDWQPCPTGVCQAWGEVATRLTVDGVARRRNVVVSGTLEPPPTRAASVTVALQKRMRAGSAWRPVKTVTVRVDEGSFSRAFDRPAAVQCRAKATYFDASPVSPALTGYPKDTAVFSC